MSIIRSPRPEGNFYVLDKRISEDKRLTWASRGLLVYLLGKPDHWQVSPQALKNETKDSRKPTGRDGVYALLDELISAGYITRKQERSPAGVLGEVNYLVSESSCSSPLPPLPDTAQPYAAQPYPAKTTQVSIDKKQEFNKKQELSGGERTHSQANATTTPAPVPANDFEPVPAQAQSPAKPTQAQAHSYPSQPAPTAPSAPQKPVKAPKPACSAATPEIDIPADLLADFLVVRKSKRAGPLTNTAIAGLKREAAKAGISLEAAVTACCEYGWQGFNATWYADRTTTATAPARRASSPRTPAPENFADRVYVGGRL